MLLWFLFSKIWAELVFQRWWCSRWLSLWCAVCRVRIPLFPRKWESFLWFEAVLKYRKSLNDDRQSKRNSGAARVRRAIMERLLRELRESDTMSILHLGIESSICHYDSLSGKVKRIGELCVLCFLIHFAVVSEYWRCQKRAFFEDLFRLYDIRVIVFPSSWQFVNI